MGNKKEPINPIQKITVLDWDSTVSIEHTFLQHHFHAPRCMHDADSDKNIKEGLKLRHSAQHPLAIATYHDNLEYIEAQLKAAYLKSNPEDTFELKRFKKAYTADSRHFHYQYFTVIINGITCIKPIIIAYLPTDDFDAHRKYLMEHGNKNMMIEAIRAALDAKNTQAYFFDDTKENCESAAKLKNVKAYHVTTGNVFEATLIQKRSSVPLLFCYSRIKPEHVIDTQRTKGTLARSSKMVYIQQDDEPEDEGFRSRGPSVEQFSIV